MACDSADAAAAPGSCAGEVDVRVVGFCAPEWLICFSLIVVEEGEIEIAVEDVNVLRG